jgi:hypothetical protein
MPDQGRDTSSSYLVELRKLATQKREHNREHNRVSQDSWEAGLTRREDTSGAWGEGKEETWAESQEEGGGHEQIGLGERDLHRLGDEAVHEEEHERVEEDRHLVGLAVHELDVLARGGNENTWAEREKKGGWDSDFLRSDIWDGEHLIYVHIIFREVDKVIHVATPHHLLVEVIIIYVPPDVSPYVGQAFFKPLGLFLVFPGYTFV